MTKKNVLILANGILLERVPRGIAATMKNQSLVSSQKTGGINTLPNIASASSDRPELQNTF